MIRSRAGNRAPAAVVSGSANASTSESPPLKPDHATNRIALQSGNGSLLSPIQRPSPLKM